MNDAEIRSHLEKDPGWADEAGNSLLHYSACSGDEELVRQCLRNGVKTLVYNKQNECARDVARAWGHDKIAGMIDAAMKIERAEAPAPPIAYASLQEIRDKSSAGSNLFYALAERGLFDQVIALAEKYPYGLTANDLLGKGINGETTILKICQQGQLPLLMKPELWTRNMADFPLLSENIPKIYRKEIDTKDFMASILQLKLRSRMPNTQLKGPRG